MEIPKSSESKIIINAQTLQNIFLAISKKNLDKITLCLRPTLDKTTSEAELEKLQNSFKYFLESLSSDLYGFVLYLGFKDEGESKKEIGVNIFNHLPKFIKKHKTKLDTFEKIYVRIDRNFIIFL